MTTSPAPVPRRTEKLVSVLRAVPAIGTWLGLLLVASGFVLLMVAWGRTAHQKLVGAQLPYVMSAGLTGLGLVCCGLTAIVIDAKLRDRALKSEQNVELQRAIAAIAERDAAPPKARRSR